MRKAQTHNKFEGGAVGSGGTKKYLPTKSSWLSSMHLQTFLQFNEWKNPTAGCIQKNFCRKERKIKLVILVFVVQI